MRKLWLALFLLAGLAPAKAQVVTTWPPPAGTIAFLCVYNSSVPTPTNGSPYYAQCDGSGNLRVAAPSGGLQVQGPAANGAVPSGNPIWFAGWDGTDLRAISTDSSGRINVNVNGSVAVTGTFWPYTLGQQTPANSVPVTEATDYANTISSSVTRPANTTTYTANTGWCTLTSSCVTTFVWANACRANGGNIYITGYDLYSSANPSTKLQGALWLFNVTPATVINDNATFTIASADFANLVGGSFNGMSFTLASQQASAAANSGTSVTGANQQAQCAAGSTTLYGMVEVTNAYVPVSGEVLTAKLHTIGLN